jgi:hypothetical protein
MKMFLNLCRTNNGGLASPAIGLMTWQPRLGPRGVPSHMTEITRLMVKDEIFPILLVLKNRPGFSIGDLAF